MEKAVGSEVEMKDMVVQERNMRESVFCCFLICVLL